MRPLRTLVGLVQYEWVMLLRSPVAWIGMVAALAWVLMETPTDVGWPTVNSSLYAFQLAGTMMLGISTFLLAAGCVARDLEGSRGEVLFCRPVSMSMYVTTKFLGVFLFALAMAGILGTLCLCLPVVYGKWHIYQLRPFLLVLGFCMGPMLAYTCSLALALMISLRKYLIALPIYLLYFFFVSSFSLSDKGTINLFDFTMRLYPRYLVTEVPLRLTDFSFDQLLMPVAPELAWRAAIHVALGLLLLMFSVWVLNQRHTYRGVQRLPWFSKWWQESFQVRNRTT
jgi:ABC-type transport system involved in multi-copper enzyme maturation permease subunit